MWDIKNAIISGMASIFDITWSAWKGKILEVYIDNVLKWFETDGKNISWYFKKARWKTLKWFYTKNNFACSSNKAKRFVKK